MLTLITLGTLALWLLWAASLFAALLNPDAENKPRHHALGSRSSPSAARSGA